MVIVGAGNLGQAIANHTYYYKAGFIVSGIFEINPRLIGIKINDIEVMDYEKIVEYVEENNIDIGIICTTKDAAQEVADLLKNKRRCDLVICLSHQGTYSNPHGIASDEDLAKATRNIDIIIGAHTHKMVENLFVNNLDGDSVLLMQTGKAGARIGKISVKI